MAKARRRGTAAGTKDGFPVLIPGYEVQTPQRVREIWRYGRFDMVWRRWFGTPVLTPVESRQGFLDRPVLVVLVASTILVCLAFGIAWLTI